MNQQYATYQQVDARVRINAFIQSVYLWMGGALAISGIVAYIIGTNMSLLSMFINFRTGQISPLWIGCAVVEVGLVFFFSMRLARMAAGTATIVYIVYSVLSGVTLAPIFIAYTHSSIASVFFICAATFGVASFFGFVTKRNLAGIGSFLFMGLIGLIIAMIVGLVFKSPALQMIISVVGVIVFVGLTVYHTQKMKNMALSMPDDATKSMIRKAALNSALSLYLDFINLFLMLLRILGNRN